MPVINGKGRVGIRRPSAVSALLLDTYSGAAVAYSLRKLSSAYSGSAIRSPWPEQHFARFRFDHTK